ncbi:MAG: hypothetical protein CFE26_01885 [Verrucomicrobiales bacterium VVV1]|nr:MAG: hypothetical protein CFE26_01885 [Verrucomicrobiales bacterium VVV1]
MSGFPIDQPGLADTDTRSVIVLLSGIAGISTNHLILKRTLLDGLCRLILADKWMSIHHASGDSELASPQPAFLHRGFSEAEFRDITASAAHSTARPLNSCFRNKRLKTKGQFTVRLEDYERYDAWLTSPSGTLATAAGTGTFILSISPMDGAGTSCNISLYRTPGSAPFTDKELRTAHLVFSGVAWLHQRGWTEITDYSDATSLPPRLQPLLALLLQGSSRKLISEIIGIKVNTVNSYTKEIYRHFGVHSQPELMRIHFQIKAEGPGG